MTATLAREVTDPPSPADCSIHHGAFGAGCPWCSPRTRTAATDGAAGRSAGDTGPLRTRCVSTQEGTKS